MAFATRFALYFFVITIIGSVSFALIVIPRALEDLGRRAELQRKAAGAGLVAAVLVIPVVFARLYLQLDAMRFPGEPLQQSVGPLMTGTIWGAAWAMQILAALLLVLSFARARASGSEGKWLPLAAIPAIAFVLTLPLSGHAASVQPYPVVAITADFLHVLGAGSWLGTLGILTATVLVQWRADDAESTLRERAALVHAFSPLAQICVAVVVASGVLASLLHIHSVGELFSSLYGQRVIIKVAAVAVVLLFGYLNWKRNTARIADDKGAGLRSGALRELGATLLVLLVTSLLVVTPPP